MYLYVLKHKKGKLSLLLSQIGAISTKTSQNIAEREREREREGRERERREREEREILLPMHALFISALKYLFLILHASYNYKKYKIIRQTVS